MDGDDDVGPAVVDEAGAVDGAGGADGRVVLGREAEGWRGSAERLLHRALRRSGVGVGEYGKAMRQGKVAVSEDHWASVGPANLDARRLKLNNEASVVLVRHREETA
ncbi:hypothetical protein ACU7M1_32325, partial [Burkholderia pseudomallei]